MVLPHCTPRFDVELLHFRHTDAIASPHMRDLNRIGFNHLCFAVEGLEAEVARLEKAGVRFRSQVLDYLGRKIVLMEGPEGLTFELAEWDARADAGTRA